MKYLKCNIFQCLIVLVLSGMVLSGNAQNRYRLYFKDKKAVEFNPYLYFDQKAIERRIVNNIPLLDESDFPVNPVYISSVAQIADSLGFISRWFNFACVYISSESQLRKLASLPFVREIEKVQEVKVVYASREIDDKEFEDEVLILMNRQTARMGGDIFSKNNINGKGVRIAIFDGGFPMVNTNPVFEHIRQDNRIVKTYDFIKKKEFVYYGNKHGAMTMACVGGKFDGKKIGLATGQGKRMKTFHL